MVCDVNRPGPLFQVDIRDAANQPVPGIEVFLSWEGGEGHFFTGLQLEMGLGYGDYAMAPIVIYSIHLTDGCQPINDLTAAVCIAEDGSKYRGSW